MAEGARLESVYTATYRGFESPPHRHIRDESLYASTGFFLLYSPLGGMRTPDRGSTTGAASWTDREPASGLPRRGERSESIPPSPPYLKKSSYASTGFFRMWHPLGDENPDRGSTTGAASWTNRARSKRAARGRAKRVNPHRHILRRARTQVRAFRMWHPPGMRTPTGVRQLTTDITQYCQSQTLLHTINSAAKMFANTIPLPL